MKKFFYVNVGPTALAVIESEKTGSKIEFIFESKRNYFLTEVIVSSYMQEEGSITSFKEIILLIENSESPDLNKGLAIRGSYNSIVGTGTFVIYL